MFNLHHQHRTARPAATGPRRHGSAGFTLIEVMITVAIVAILATIALPSYRDYLIRGYLADASNGLAMVQAQMERHFQDNRTYVTVVTPPPGSLTFESPCATTSPAPRTFTNFVISCSAGPAAASYTLLATGNGPVAGFSFTLTQDSVRATTTAASGWNTCTRAWLTKKGQPCV